MSNKLIELNRNLVNARIKKNHLLRSESSISKIFILNMFSAEIEGILNLIEEEEERIRYISAKKSIDYLYSLSDEERNIELENDIFDAYKDDLDCILKWHTSVPRIAINFVKLVDKKRNWFMIIVTQGEKSKVFNVFVNDSEARVDYFNEGTDEFEKEAISLVKKYARCDEVVF